MKTIKLLSLFAVLILLSCSTDDKSDEVLDEYPRISNIKFEAISTPAMYGHVQVIINNDYDGAGYTPFNMTIAQMEIERRTFLKLDFEDHPYVNEGNTYHYEVTLKIYENNKVIAEKQFTVTNEEQEDYLEYTFE